MKYLHKLYSQDELEKNYNGTTETVSAIVVNGITYEYEGMRSGSSYYYWVNPNDTSQWVDSDEIRYPKVGGTAYEQGDSSATIENVISTPVSGRNIDYKQPWVSWLPNVSVNYNKYRCDFNGHYDYVDLGLPSGTLWATCNVGATSPEQIGGYYAWGETQTKNTYGWGNYKFGTDDDISKYNINDNIPYLEPVDDVVNVTMGGDWHIPSYAAYSELSSNTYPTYEVINGVLCKRLTSNINGKSLFLPVTGYMENESIVDAVDVNSITDLNTLEVQLYYWTNGRMSGLSDSGIIVEGTNMYKYYGLQVRGIITPTNSVVVPEDYVNPGPS